MSNERLSATMRGELLLPSTRPEAADLRSAVPGEGASRAKLHGELAAAKAGGGEPVKNAQLRLRAQDPRTDARVMLGAGAVLTGAAAFFLWRDLQVPPELLVATVAVAAAITSAVHSRKWPLAGPLVLLGTSVVGALWYAATREPVLLAGLGASFLANAFLVARVHRGLDSQVERLRAFVTWFGLAVATLATSAAFYFQFLTLNLLHDETWRRLILTLGWLGLGLWGARYARGRKDAVVRDASFLMLAAAVGKALLYDTAHLAGWQRIAVLAVSGLALLGSGFMALRRPTEAEGR